jgi:hypothetical protein
VTAVLAIDGVEANWSISDVKLEGAAAQKTVSAADGRSFVATFMKKDLLTLPVGTAVDVAVTGTLERDGVSTPFAAAAVVRVVK